jgi:hypothetical protein
MNSINQLMNLPVLEQVIDPSPISVGPETPLIEAISCMSQSTGCHCALSCSEQSVNTDLWGQNFNSCVLVVERSRLVGIFTERDVVRLTASGVSLPELGITDVMTQPVITMTLSDSATTLSALELFKEHQIRHLPVVDNQGNVLGLITPHQIRQALQPTNLLRLRRVAEVITPQVVNASRTTSVLKIAQLMADHRVSCVVITDSHDQPSSSTRESLGTPVGIITERDIVQFRVLGLNLEQIQAEALMSTPLFYLHPADTLWTALQQMQARHVRRLVVAGDAGELKGIVTQSSLIQGLDPIEVARIVEILQQELEKRTLELHETNLSLQQELRDRKQIESQLPLFCHFGIFERKHVFSDNEKSGFKPRMTEEGLRSAQAELEHQVQHRTQELMEANAQLAQELLERERFDVERRRFESEREQTRMVLQRNEEQLRLAFDLNDIGLWARNITSGLVTWNTNQYHLLGFQSWEVEPGYEVWRTRIHPDDMVQVEQRLTQALDTQTDYEAEYRVILRDGSIRWLLDKGRGLYDETGQPLRMIGVMFDITERKQNEVALHESALEIADLYNNAPCGYHSVNAAGVFVNINDTELTWLGYTRDEIVGKKKVTDLLTPEGVKTFQKNFPIFMQQGWIKDLEFEMIRKDRTILPILLSATAVKDSSGQFLRSRSTVYDISDRKQAEAQQAFQASLLNQVQNAVIATDLEGRVTYWNQFAQQLYQLTPEDLGRSILDVTVPVKQQEIAAEIMASIQATGRWEGEFEVQRRDGSSFTAYVIDSLIRDPVGNPSGIVGISMDITAQKQLESQFLRAQRLESLGTLASGIAHDLNNILTPMLAMASLLPLNLPPLSERSQQLLNIMNENAKRGANLVKQILTFARGLEGERAPVQVKHLLRELEQVVSSTFPKSITLTRNIATEDLWLVSADATQLHQVFMNFCVNARDAMPEGGTLTISAENRRVDEMFAQMHLDAKVGSHVAITFADTGVGISPENIDRIFEPFFTTKVVGEGTGLGLSTVLGIVKHHGGFVTVSSKLGQGTEFQVFLPAIISSETPPEVYQEPPTGKGELILIVDDEENIRETLKLSLENQNYRVLTAKDGVDAISTYAAHQSDIQAVLIDMMMPSMGGATAIAVLQRLNPQIKIIACSGTENKDNLDTLTCVKAFLSKPFTVDDLLNTLQTILTEA